MTGPGTSLTRSHNASGDTPGVNPVLAASGSTSTSAPVASTQRSMRSTQAARLALTDSGVSGPGAGGTWTAAATNGSMASPSGPAPDERADNDTEQGGGRPEHHPAGEVAADPRR